MAVRFESQTEPIAGYRLLERLGSGGFGEVWKAEAPGGIFKAIKIIHGDLRNRETDAYRFAEQELKALKRVKQVRHPYLLALDRFDIVEGRLMIVMELADCNLWDRFRACRRQGLPGIPRDELLQYMAETAEVLDLMNDQFQLQHLDIKPQNLFLLYNHVKVADFGQVKDLEGMVASVTGGITPVYAAPETFDGFVSRFCDQYSLACVYQELLTGHRPFDGTSMQQLLMQHLQMPPNLTPSPPADRSALSRALSKKSEDRFPTVTAMVNALRAGIDPAARASVPAGVPTAAEPPSEALSAILAAPQAPGLPPGGSGSLVLADSTPSPRGLVETAPPPDRPVPPEVTGPGPLRPALVIGLGYTGLRVVQRFRKQLGDRFGPPESLPLVRTLYVDTDPDALAAAATDQPWAGLAGLPESSIFPARLNRSGHYLKPRLNGRTLLEGWFDPQLLYKLPRNPSTMGLRPFGRLAFCDHYRPLMQKVEAEIDAALDPQALADTRAATGLDVRTNRPRVYVVAGLGGGTGGGMFLDLAYAVRAKLKRLGYLNPDVVGVLLVPPDAPPGEVSPLAQANTYASLTELHHYAHPDTTFVANHDDRAATIHDADPPFSQVFLLPGLPHPPAPPPGGSSVLLPSARASGSVAVTQTTRGMSGPVNRSAVFRGSGTMANPPARSGVFRGSGAWGGLPAPGRPSDLDAPGRDPSAAAAEFLRLELLSPVGRAAEERRPQPVGEDSSAAVRTFGVGRIGWPRAEVVARAARVIAPVLIGHWVSPDPAQVRTVIPGWAADQWARVGLDPDKLAARLAEAADDAAGAKLERVIAVATEPLVPRGWLPKLPDPEAVSVALDKLHRLLGRPGPANRVPTPVEEQVNEVAGRAARSAHTALENLFPGLIETPLFRLAGTEEAIRQVLALLDRAKLQYEQQVAELEKAAGVAFDQLTAHINSNQRGMRKLTIPEFTEALAKYPASQHRLLIARGVLRAYRHVRELLTGLLTEVSGCRVRVEACRPVLAAEADLPAAPPAEGDLLPPGCRSTEDAAQVFIRSLTDDDLAALDARIQEALERTAGGLYRACLNSAEGVDGVLRVVREETRAYLDARIGEVDLATMFQQRFGDRQTAAVGLAEAFERAAPTLVGGGPWARAGLAVFAAPGGAGGAPIRQVAAAVLPEGTATADARDEVVIYREYPGVPLVAVPQLGPAWSAAYRAAPEVQQVTPHVRTDVTRWIDVDSV